MCDGLYRLGNFIDSGEWVGKKMGADRAYT